MSAVKHRFTGVEAALDALIRALRPWATDPAPCATRTYAVAPVPDCDCWACVRTRDARRALSVVDGHYAGIPSSGVVPLYACADGVPGCLGDAERIHTHGTSPTKGA